MGKRRDPIKEAERKLQQEGERQALLIHGAAAIALYRNWGWRKNRILGLLDATETAWNECAGDIKHSMIEMCVKETGIEIQRGDGKTWEDLHYLNNSIDPGRMTPAKWIFMRRQQMKWMAPQIVAGVLLALHRKSGFGFERCTRIYEQIKEIQNQYDNDPKRIQQACLEETGVRIHEKLKRKEV